MEKELWSKQIFGIGSAQQLLWTVYFLVGKYFCLRGGLEHHSLLWGANSQIKVVGMGNKRYIQGFFQKRQY